MEVYFNELSLNEETVIQYHDVRRLGRLYTCLYGKGILPCRISPEMFLKIMQGAENVKEAYPNIMNLLLSFFRSPFETRQVEERQDYYLSHYWEYQGKTCFGLALAFIMDSMSVSVCDPFWGQPILYIEMDGNPLSVRNLFDEATFHYHLEWIDSMQPLELVICSEKPEDKRCKLRDDHGKDVLQTFCKRLLKSEYVCEIVNSLPFNAENRRFIHKIYNNGMIEVVLPWTDKGYGIVIKTTGRNYRETEAIAKLLKEEYGILS